jgi:hypothetical protein
LEIASDNIGDLSRSASGPLLSSLADRRWPPERFPPACLQRSTSLDKFAAWLWPCAEVAARGCSRRCSDALAEALMLTSDTNMIKYAFDKASTVITKLSEYAINRDIEFLKKLNKKFIN